MKKLIIAVFVLLACARNPQPETNWSDSSWADSLSPGDLIHAGVSDADVASFIQHNHRLAIGMHLPIIAAVCGEVGVVTNDNWLWMCNATSQLLRVSITGEIMGIYQKRMFLKK